MIQEVPFTVRPRVAVGQRYQSIDKRRPKTVTVKGVNEIDGVATVENDVTHNVSTIRLKRFGVRDNWKLVEPSPTDPLGSRC